jgi:hypothetical protein
MIKIDNLVSKSGNTPNSMIKLINESISKLNAPIDICYLHQNDIEIISEIKSSAGRVVICILGTLFGEFLSIFLVLLMHFLQPKKDH